MGKHIFLPVTMRVEPTELATIEAIAKSSAQSRSDIIRKLVTLGIEQMLESAFASQGEKGPLTIFAAFAHESVLLEG